jgi:hypothetical protein
MTDSQSASLSWCQVPIWDLWPIFLSPWNFRQLRVCNFVAPSLTRGRVCKLLYNCFWALPEQSLLGQSPADSQPYFTVSSETLLTWRARSPYVEVTLVQCEISKATSGRAAWEARSATWNFGANSAFALGSRKTTENLDRVGRSQDLPNATDF